MLLLSIQILAALGLLVAVYASFAHLKVAQDSEYKAVCDITDRVSCSKTFKSEYGKFLGIPIGFYGAIFYAIIFILASYSLFDYLLYFSIAGVIASGILAYLLYFKIKTICLVCNSIYVINIALFILTLIIYNRSSIL